MASCISNQLDPLEIRIIRCHHGNTFEALTPIVAVPSAGICLCDVAPDYSEESFWGTMIQCYGYHQE
jgi:hypothetical protein